MAAYISFQPTDFFSPKIYAGSASAVTVTGLDFQPDMTWTKDRQNTGYHALIDAVNGVGKYTQPDNASVQSTVANNCITSFTSDGFVTGTAAPSNNSSSSGIGFISWNWKANGAGSSNTDGGITSTVSANTTSGVSIVTWTGTGSASTIGHGLGVAPAMVILKSTSNGYSWYTWHKGLSSEMNKYVQLDTTGAVATDTSAFGSTAPTATVFPIGTGNAGTNSSGHTYVAYCFTDIKGYSKMGSYIGNGNADGAFLYTGFRPAYVLIKKTNGAGSWWVFDDKRLGYNEANYRLYADDTAAENTDAVIDFVSNGFKLRTTDGDLNGAGNTIIYTAFAEFPLVSSNSKAGTAR